MHKHQRVAHVWHVKYERLRHAMHEYKSILPDHIACHACGNIVDFHLAFVHARVPMSLHECYPSRMPTASKRPNSRDPATDVGSRWDPSGISVVFATDVRSLPGSLPGSPLFLLPMLDPCRISTGISVVWLCHW